MLRRRFLCIRPRLQGAAGTILQNEGEEWIEALSLHADVISVDDDLDLARMCEEVKPDAIIIGPTNWARPSYPRIDNPRFCPEIPRVLFMQCDPHDPMRASTFHMATMLGVEAAFVNGDAYLQHMPALRRFPVFFAPQFLDGDVFNDYRLDKIFPISVFGGRLLPGFYPWRAKLIDEIQQIYPTLIYTHPGYQKQSNSPFSVHGEAYARLLNRSWFSAADTTRLDYGVRKHLEIPASGAVLIAPDSDALRSYGFADGVNCLLGAGTELYSKIDRLARDAEAYERVRQAGMSLVTTRYTRRSWRFILDWFECRARLKPGQVVQQVDRYGRFDGVTPSSSTPYVLARAQRDSDMAAALKTGAAAVLSGHGLAEAETTVGEAANWLDHAAEPRFLLGLMALLRGDPVSAATAIGRRAEGQATIDKGLDFFDPVETAWLLLIARLIDSAGLEAVLREHAASVNHVGLRRTFWLLDGPATDPAAEDGLLRQRPGDVPSIHWLGEEDFNQWRDLVRRASMANRTSPGAAAVTQRLLAA